MVLNVVSDMREVRTEPCSVMNEAGPAPDGVGADIVGKALRDWRVKPNKANQSGSEEGHSKWRSPCGRGPKHLCSGWGHLDMPHEPGGMKPKAADPTGTPHSWNPTVSTVGGGQGYLAAGDAGPATGRRQYPK